MTAHTSILLILFCSTAALRADLVLYQQAGNARETHVISTKIHDGKMRADDVTPNVSIIVDLTTRDSYTLLRKSKVYLNKFGSEIRWEMQEDKKYTGGTNEMDYPAAPAVATGRMEKVNGHDAEIYTWSGAHGLTETLWVDPNFPNYAAIRTELAKVDKFNDTGPHRNGQPLLSLLPGMVLKSESVIKGVGATNVLVAVKVEPVDTSFFEIPTNYARYQPPQNKSHETNSVP